MLGIGYFQPVPRDVEAILNKSIILGPRFVFRVPLRLVVSR